VEEADLGRYPLRGLYPQAWIASRKRDKRMNDLGQGRAEELFILSELSADHACPKLASSASGLAAEEAERRLKTYGLNLVAREQRPTLVQEIWGRAKNPLNALLLTLAIASYFIGDIRAAIVILIMVLLSVITAFIQEHRSNEAAARLRAMVKTTASVRRAGGGDFAEVPLETLVPGHIVRLSAGDMIPADLRLLETMALKEKYGFRAAGEIADWQIGPYCQRRYMHRSLWRCCWGQQQHPGHR
jgi:magnesium-transporting ATPase (P-type)